MIQRIKRFVNYFKLFYPNKNVLTNPYLGGIIITKEVSVMETVGQRFKLSRKELNLTMQQVGEQLGVSRDVINNIENDRLKKPEQKEPLFKLYCKLYGISYPWLMEGIGKPLIEFPKTVLDDLALKYGLDDEMKMLIQRFVDMSPEEKEVIKKLFALTKKDKSE